jgi:cyclic pyranopterin phosphate synthase
MSIDTLDRHLHHEITGVDDLPAVVLAAERCVDTGVPVKVNMVVMSGVNDDSVSAVVDWCEKVGVRSLKLLDVIADLDAGAESFARRLAARRGKKVRDLYVPLEDIARPFEAKSSVRSVRTQGDLGHPMTIFTMATGLELILKDSRAGAWYSGICEGCRFFPCHDALMALRLTADRRLQFCLLRDDLTVNLDGPLRRSDDSELRDVVQSALAVYSGAEFRAASDDHALEMR